MADYKDRLAGSPTGIATSLLVGSGPLRIAQSSETRISISVSPEPNALTVVGVASSMNASVAAIGFIPSSVVGQFVERDYRGDLYVACPGGTKVVTVWDVVR